MSKFETENDLRLTIKAEEKEILVDEVCCTSINIILKNDDQIMTSFLGAHNPEIVKNLEKAMKIYFKGIKKTLNMKYKGLNVCGCGEHCECDEHCEYDDCNCEKSADKCKCGDDCNCNESDADCKCGDDCNCKTHKHHAKAEKGSVKKPTIQKASESNKQSTKTNSSNVVSKTKTSKKNNKN